MLVGSDSAYTMLIAYEHGSQAPDAFVRFELESSRQVAVKAVRATIMRVMSRGENPYETIGWKLEPSGRYASHGKSLLSIRA
jgi:hypothetical protein